MILTILAGLWFITGVIFVGVGLVLGMKDNDFWGFVIGEVIGISLILLCGRVLLWW